MARRTRFCSLSALMLLALGVSPGVAQEPAEGTKIGDWIVRCKAEAGGPRICLLVQDATGKVQDKTSRIMNTVVGRFGKEKRLGLIITLPLGLYLPAGLILRVDGKPEAREIPYQLCTSAGCRAAFLFDDEWLGLFKGGLKATVTVQNSGRKELTVPMSLRGFTKGLQTIGAG